MKMKRQAAPATGSKLFLIIGVLNILLVTSCANKNETKGAAQQGAGGPPAYNVLTLSPRQTTLFTDYPATIQGQQNVEIRPKVDGYIETIYVDEGATVQKGQTLFRISAPQYEQEVRRAQADIKIAQADVNAARMQVAKVQPLVEKNIISKYELESAQFSLQSRQAALAQAQALLANARTNLGYTNITSPVAGVIGTIPYKIGSLVSSNTAEPLTTVSNIGRLFVYFSVNEKQSLAFIKSTKGATTTAERLATLPPVTLILSDGSEFSEKGKIETASGMINTETGSVSVRATFRNPGNMIRSGSTGAIRLPQTVDSALMVPQKATYEIQGKRFVYVVQKDNTVKSVEIRVVDSSSGQYFVVEQGLKPGDRIVLEGIATLKEDTPVKPIVANADSVYRTMLQ